MKHPTGTKYDSQCMFCGNVFYLNDFDPNPYRHLWFLKRKVFTNTTKRDIRRRCRKNRIINKEDVFAKVNGTSRKIRNPMR